MTRRADARRARPAACGRETSGSRLRRLRGALALPLLLIAGTPAAGQGEAFTYREMGTAVLQALDKVTARISTLSIPLERTRRFGTLEVTVWACRKRPPEEPPESAVFLTIVERRRDAPPVRLFQGWMFASSPAMSALEHPVYDIWALDCLGTPVE